MLSVFRPRAMAEHAVVCMMTSQVEGLRFPLDCVVEDLVSAGLPKPTLVRVCKIVTIDSTLIVKRLGRLAAADRRAVRDRLKELFLAN